MTNKKKALRLVWEHCRVEWSFSYERFIGEELYLHSMTDIPLEHAKLTASKIAEYNVEEGRNSGYIRL